MSRFPTWTFLLGFLPFADKAFIIVFESKIRLRITGGISEYLCLFINVESFLFVLFRRSLIVIKPMGIFYPISCTKLNTKLVKISTVMFPKAHCIAFSYWFRIIYNDYFTMYLYMLDINFSFKNIQKSYYFLHINIFWKPAKNRIVKNYLWFEEEWTKKNS